MTDDNDNELCDALPVVMVGPLSAEEWVSLRQTGKDDDLLQCCAETSVLRDEVFMWLRMGGEEGLWGSSFLREFRRVNESHEGLDKDPRIAKLVAFAEAWEAERHRRIQERRRRDVR